MYCICADGGTLGKQDNRRCTFDDDEGNSSCGTEGYWKSGEHGPSRTIMDRSNMALRSARCRTPVVIDVMPLDDHRPFHRQHEPPTTSSYSSTSSSAVSMPANGGHFSRRRQSLVEALSNPVPSTRSNSPTSPTPIGLLAPPCARSATAINISNRPSSSVVPGSNDHLDNEHRLFAIDELIRCERDYVGLLSALHEGFLKPACQHSELFDTHLVRAIFGNLHQLQNLHEKLLFDLEAAVSKTPVCLGGCFLQHVCTRPTFEAYTHYCNNHQRSCRRLSQLYELDAYRTFFEECRRLCRLPTLRLDAFLLRPVQQLCRYPLLLATLLQRTPKAHHDYKAVSAALQATQQLLTVVNNRRRLFEQLQELARWQKSVADWKGPDLLQTSSRLVYSGELVCTCYIVGDNVPRWRKRVFVFLFDRLLVLCRKDRLKKQLAFKTRVELDGTNKSCLLNGGAWQLTAPTEGKRFLFKASSKQEAKLWLEALNKERYLVQQTARLPTTDEKMLAIELAKDQDP